MTASNSARDDDSARLQTLDTTVAKPVTCQYWLIRPPPEAGAPPYPLLLFLHGAGERGDDPQRVLTHGPIHYAREHADFPFLLVAPHCAGLWWDNDLLIALLDEVAAHHQVDPERVYLTGLSMGGYGTWSLAIEHPHRFAAIAPVCGGGFSYLADRLRHIPVWAFHGAKDGVVPLHASQRMVDCVNAAGGDARLTIYPDAEHDSWTPTYQNPDLYAWLLRHRRRVADT